MDVLPSNDQSRLIGAIEQAIAHTKEGMSPNQAIEKVARDNKYNPPFINRMVQGFNKAKAVHVMKEASAETRHEPFELADSPVIVQSIYNPVQKEASVDFQIPGNLAEVAVPRAAVEKTASLAQSISHIRNPELTAASYTRALQSHKDFFEKMEKIATAELSYHQQKFMDAVEKICDECRYMTQRTLEKTASKACNIYPANGDKMMLLVAKKIGRTLSDSVLEKTASGHILPAKEPFLSMQEAYERARSISNAEIWHEQVQKEAAAGAGVLNRFLTNAAASKFSSGGEATGVKAEDKAFNANEALSPNYYNKIKALDAKRALYDMMLNDDKFKTYDSAQVVGAWNSLSRSHPKLMTENPAAASTLMLQQLETGGRRDLHEIEQAQKIEKGLGDKG